MCLIQTLTLADVWSGLTDSWLGGSQQANDIVTSSKAPEIFVVFAGTQVCPFPLLFLHQGIRMVLPSFWVQALIYALIWRTLLCICNLR